MLPAPDRLLEGFTRYAARRRREPTCDAPLVRAALREAAKLARGNERDEPAALFFSFARRPRAFGDLQGDMLVLLAAGQARSMSLELRFEPIEIVIHTIAVCRISSTPMLTSRSHLWR